MEKDGYSGDVIGRALGHPPVLKRERNGHICGTSLEFHPECQVDGEFAEFYTSDPKLFRVRLEVMDAGTEGDEYNGTLFEGFISPELYSEPDIAPPYDVSVIATDGLGELKRYLYEAQGQKTLKYILEGLLEKTGVSRYFCSNNRTLSAGGSYTVPAAKFFDEAKVDLDFLAGKTCYDVLASILDTIHADCFYYKNTWVLLRETEVETGSSVVIEASPYGSSYDDARPATVFGSMQDYSIWPIGHMETEIKPACKRLMVKSEAQYKSALVNSDMSSDTGWTKYNASYDTNLGAFKITSRGGSIDQNVHFATPLYKSLKLSIAVRQYRPTAGSTSLPSTVGVRVVRTFTLHGTTYDFCLYRGTDGSYSWTTSDNTLSFDLPAPNYGDTADDCVTLDLDLPIFRYSTAGADYIHVYIFRDSSNIPLLVHSAYLKIANEIAGYQDVFVIDNGAREEAPDVDSILLPSGSGFYSTPPDFVYNNILGANNAAVDIFTQVGTDYARSCAVARQRKSGTLNIPAGGPVTLFPPIAFRDSAGNNYIPQSWEWDLFNCEMTVEMLSLPTASVTISEQTVTEMVYRGGSASSSGSSGGSGGGGGGTGGGTVTSVGLGMPDGFSVSGSPVTGAGTIRVGLDNTRYIPTVSEKAAWNAAVSVAHSHSNKAQLDRITQHGADFLAGVDENMLAVAPTIKKFWLQANSSTPTQEQPFFFIRHPLIRMGADAEFCLMVYRKRNGGSGTRKTHRKGWFLACGEEHAASAAWVQPVSTAVSGSTAVQVIDILDGIARTYCQIYGAVHNQDYADWLFWMTQIGPDFNAFGFAGTPEAVVFKRKLHLGIALRVVNPDFTSLVDPQRTLHVDTGSIQGVPRYLYSAVAPLTARMYAEAKSGQPRGGVVFDLI